MDIHKLEMQQVRRLTEDIAYLSGQDTEGRMSGSRGAKKAAEYLVNQLVKAGYQHAPGIDFMVPVDVTALRLTGKPQLKVGNREFQFRTDFAELNAVTSGGTVSGNLLVLRDGDDVNERELTGNVVLIPERPDGFDVRATSDAASKAGVTALLIEYGEPPTFHKSPHGSPEAKIPVLRIRKRVARDLRTLANPNVLLELPLERRTLPCQNVLGYLPARQEATDTLVLTAHYDHLGDDPEGEGSVFLVRLTTDRALPLCWNLPGTLQHGGIHCRLTFSLVF